MAKCKALTALAVKGLQGENCHSRCGEKSRQNVASNFSVGDNVFELVMREGGLWQVTGCDSLFCRQGKWSIMLPCSSLILPASVTEWSRRVSRSVTVSALTERPAGWPLYSPDCIMHALQSISAAVLPLITTIFIHRHQQRQQSQITDRWLITQPCWY